MENTDGSKSRLSVAEMRASMARAAAELAKMQAAIEIAEVESVATIRESVLANMEAGITPGVYMVAIADDGTVQVTRSKSVARVAAAPRAAGSAPTTHDADPYWTPGLSRGAVATDARRMFYAESLEPAAIATALGTSPGAVNRALGPMAEARSKRNEQNA
jgi:hypothetical protein